MREEEIYLFSSSSNLHNSINKGSFRSVGHFGGKFPAQYVFTKKVLSDADFLIL